MDRAGSRANRQRAPLIADLFPVNAVEQPQSTILGDRDVAFILKRTRRRRTIAFSVDGNGLVVSAPWNASESRIKRSVLEAADWILEKLDEWADHQPRQQHWIDGEQIVFLGRNLTLKVVADAVLMPAVLCDESSLKVTVADPESEVRIREAAIQWYRRHAARNFSERIAHYASAMKLPAPKMFLSNAGTQWGSCNVKGQIRLNWRLIQAPQEIVDYVVVHELAHLTEMNHSKRFWKIVQRHFPGHMDARKHLNEHGHWYLDI
ncbi:MAG: M48 family metallopeptidase [Betaproteobacteria bacterium]|nr:MAG: M48 family metallopeptidase [Betaproteobacteria bacterium]